MTKIALAIVVAVAQNGVIGRDGGLPWRMSDDLKWFKKVTMGKPIIMGRTTYNSIGKPLPGRPNIVLTRQEDVAPDGVTVVNTIEDALSTAKALAKELEVDEICLIGGATLYDQFLPYTDIIYLTRILADVTGDRSFILPGQTEWTIEQLAQIGANEKNDYPAVIERWTRNATAIY